MLQGAGGQEPIYRSLRDALITIYRVEGIQGFFKGLIPTYLKVNACSFSFFTRNLIWDSFDESFLRKCYYYSFV